MATTKTAANGSNGDGEVSVGMVHSSSFGDLNLTSDGVRIIVKDVTYEVPSFKDKKEMAKLLSRVSGIFNPGEMTALLGERG